MYKICIDIDGVLCGSVFYSEDPDYMNRVKERGVDELIQYLRDNNFEIILYTARLEEDREVTEKWLKINGIKYDELVCGKPSANIYLDDRAVTHDCMKATIDRIKSRMITIRPIGSPNKDLLEYVVTEDRISYQPNSEV